MSGMPLDECMCRRIKLARENAGLNQTQAASLMQMRRPSIAEIESGRRRVSADELKAFAKYYKVPLTWLACSNSEDTNEEKERIELAARELSKLRHEDLDRVMELLAIFRGDSAS